MQGTKERFVLDGENANKNSPGMAPILLCFNFQFDYADESLFLSGAMHISTI